MSGNYEMEQLIPVINKLQDAFTNLGTSAPIDLPQIAVIGGQSAGKSSVLENFVGRDFLPRGNGIVTRRPLILQLINGKAEYGQFFHCKDKIFTDFEEIRTEIERDTDRITGENKGISNLPINLRIYSPNVLNITLIDLPGLTKVPVGDQPADIEKQIRNMLLEYISKETCLILAVTPANTDLATSDALNLAKQVDPDGLRTIGVLTKIDLMDDGTDARDILENKFLPLKRGYVGIINRSQKDIDGKKDIDAAVLGESKFFYNHPSYRHMVDRLGTPYLQKVLNDQLKIHIKEKFPSLKDALQKRYHMLDREIAEYKNFRPNDVSTKTKAMLQGVQHIQQDFERAIEGSGTSSLNTSELSGGAKINNFFHERFPYEIMRIEHDDLAQKRSIAMAITNLRGVRSGLFTPDMAFETVAKLHIDRLREPCMKLIDLVVYEILRTVRKCTEKIRRYPRFQEETENIITTYVRDRAQACRDQVHLIINCELSYMNTNHEDLMIYSNAQNKGFSQSDSGRKLGNQVIRKGHLSLQTQSLGIMKVSSEHWFVLTAETLSWFKDEKEDEKLFTLTLDGLKIKDAESSFRSRRRSFVIYHPGGRNVYRDWKTLELSCETEEEVESWKASFTRASVLPQRSSGTFQSHVGIIPTKRKASVNDMSNDPQLKKDVDKIQNIVKSYMKIVKKTCLDMVPKTIMLIIINNVKSFLSEELLPHLYSTGKSNEMMEESEDEVAKREEMLRLHQACMEAIRIINSVSFDNSNTRTTNQHRMHPSRPAPIRNIFHT